MNKEMQSDKQSPLICVCLKPTLRVDVPLRVDSNRRRVKRDGQKKSLSTTDRECLAFANELKAEWGAATTQLWVCTVSDAPHDEALLREALVAGADSVFRIAVKDAASGKAEKQEGYVACTGASHHTQQKAQLVAEALRTKQATKHPLLVLCGVKSADEGHEAFGAFLSNALKSLFIHRALTLTGEVATHSLEATAALSRGYSQRTMLSLPAVMTVEPQGRTTEYVGWPAWAKACTQPIECWVAPPPANQSAINERVVLRAPVPRVKKQRVQLLQDKNPQQRIISMLGESAHADGIMLEGSDVNAQIKETIAFLHNRGLL